MTFLTLYYVNHVNFNLTPVPPGKLFDAIHAGSNDCIISFIQKYLHPTSGKFTIEHSTSVSFTLLINKTTKWRIYCDDQTIKIEIQINTDQFSTDVGIHALKHPCPATFVHPHTPEMANTLTSHRQRVFMGVGPARERELLVTGDVYALISPDQWDNVAAANPQYNIPSCVWVDSAVLVLSIAVVFKFLSFFSILIVVSVLPLLFNFTSKAALV